MLKLNQHVTDHRGSGLSTCTAFYLIAEALANPGTKINVRDHFEGAWSHRDLCKRIAKIAQDADLAGFEVDHAGLTIKAQVRGVKSMEWARR